METTHEGVVDALSGRATRPAVPAADAWPAPANRLRWGTHSIPFRFEFWVESRAGRTQPTVYEFTRMATNANLRAPGSRRDPY